MVSRNTISMNGNNFTHHDMVSRIKFLATEIALGTDKLLNDLFIRESINNAIVDIYGRLYDKLRYNYLSVAILDRDDPTDDYVTCFPIQLIQVGTFPYKYGYIHKNDDKVGREISEILTMNILGFSSIQFAEPNMFEQISSLFIRVQGHFTIHANAFHLALLNIENADTAIIGEIQVLALFVHDQRSHVVGS